MQKRCLLFQQDLTSQRNLRDTTEEVVHNALDIQQSR